MKNKNLLITIITGFVMLVGGFLGGTEYQKNKNSRFPGGFSEVGSRGQMIQRDGSSGFNQVRGIVLNKDDQSITVKLQDESSKIVLFTNSTTINKTEIGTKDDLKEGENIVAFGNTNPDGSITADNIQVGQNIMRSN